MQEEPNGSKNSSIHILLVDDEESFLELTTINLEGFFAITSATRPSQALKLLSEQNFDCIVSDYKMPEMNGVQLCVEVRKTSMIPFLIYTGQGSEEVATAAFAAGVDDYVRKEETLAHYQILARRIRHAVEKRRAEDALKESEARYRHLIQYAPTAIYEVNFIQRRFTSVNDAMCKIIGYTQAELLTMSPLDILDKESGIKFLDRVRKAQAGEVPDDAVEYKVVKKDGSWIWGVLNIKFTYIGSKIVGAFVVAHDVTERKMAEAALCESESVLHSFFDRPGVMRGIVDVIDGSTFRFVMVNIATADFLGLTPEAIRNKTTTELGEAPEKIRMWISHFEESRITGKQVGFEYTDNRGGKVAWLSATVNFLAVNSAGVPRYAYTILDNTERRKADEEIKRLASFPQLNPNPIVEADLSGKIHYLNPAANADFPELSRVGTMAPIALNWAETVKKLQGKGRKAVTKEAEINGVWYELSLHLVPNTDRVRVYMRDVDQRKRAEEELALQAVMLANANDAVIGYDNQYRITYWNRMAEQLYGYAADEAIGRIGVELLKPVYIGATRDEHIDTIATTGRNESESTRTTKDGRKIDVQSRVIQLKNERGEPNGYVAIDRDITERNLRERELSASNDRLRDSEEELAAINEELRSANEELSASNEELASAEEELRSSNEQVQDYADKLEKMVDERTAKLRESEEHYHTLFNSIDEGFCTVEMVFDQQGKPVDYRFLEINASFERQTGLHNVRGKLMRSIVPDYEAYWFEIYGKVALTGEPIRFTNEAKALNRWYDVYAFPVRAEEIKRVGILFNDITEKRDLQERLTTFMNSATEGFSIYDRNLDLIDVNNVVIARFTQGTKKEDLIGKNLKELYPGVEATEWYRAYLRLLKTGEPWHIERLQGVGDSRGFVLEASAFRVGDGLGVISRDMTESIELEERLRRTEVIAAVEQMGATVAHDLRGPLGQIVQSIQMAKQDPNLTPRMLKLIEENATRSLRMIANWRSSTREIVPQPVRTDLGGLVNHVLQGTTIPDNVEVTPIIEEGLDSISIDPDIMHRVIDNLVKNAVEAMPHGGTLTIEAKKGNTGTIISVSDTGVGIPEEVRSRIFAPLYTTKAGGMGLGLTYCKRAVEAHGGTLSFETETGKGTTFTILLPQRSS